MRAKHLLGEKMNKHHSAAIPGMSELGTDQYFGTYKWSKDVAGHDGKKQTAPKGDGASFKDAPVVGGISKTERNMAKKAAGGKVTKMTPDGSKEHKDVQTDSPISGSKLKESGSGKQPLFYAKNPDGTKCYARPRDAEQLAQLKQEYAGSEIKILDFNRPDVLKWLEARRINLRKFVPGMVQTMGATNEARMSTAVKLQRAWERQQAKSAASRRRGEELLNPPKKEEPKKTTEGAFHNPGEEDSPVANALTRRILLQRTDLLAKYGPEKVGQAIDEVADFVGDVDEIGSSDVSAWVRHVEQMLGNMQEGLNEFAPDDSDDNGEEDTLRKYAKMWYNGDLATQQKVEQALAKAGWEIGELESEEGGAFVMRVGDEHGDSYIGFEATDLTESDEGRFLSALKGLKTWQVVIRNNYYRGKYTDYSGRYYYVLATSEDQARQVVLDNADAILQDLLSMKAHNGKKILPRGSAVRITPERIGEIKDGTVAGRMSTAGYKKMFSPQGVIMAKLSGGEVQDVKDSVEEARKANTASARRELGKRTKKPTLSPQEQELKKKDSDESWARLMAYMDDAKKKQGVAEMDKSGPQPGRDGHVSHKTYGTRDRDEVGGPERTGKPMTAKQMMDRAHKAMMKSMSNAEKVDKGWRNPNVDEGAGNVGSVIKSLYQKIYNAGDDEIEYFYNDSPIFAQYWDEYEGDLDSIIAEVNPKELQVIRDELESYLQQAGLAEGEKSPMFKDAQQADRIRSLKNLIAIAKEQGRQLRVQELELELKKLQSVSESKMSEADAILRQIAEDEDWDLLYKIHGMAGRPTPEGMAGNIIDDMYQDVAIDSGHHADDDFEEIYNTVLDRIIEQYGIEESVQVNEVDPRNFDSDIDYYNALRRQSRKPDIDDYDPPEPYDPYAEFEREQERRRAKAAKTEPTMVYSKEEGQAPNGKRYNMTVKFTSPDKHRADYAADRWVDSEWGAKKLVDKEQHEHEGETTVTIYVQDNHKHGMWKPWKDEEPIGKPLSFEATNEDIGYKFKTSPIMMPRDTLGTDMSYHWGHGGGNKYGIDSKLGPREDPRFGKHNDGKQGYRPEYQKPSEYDHGADKPHRKKSDELHKLLAKHGQLNSKLRRLEANNVSGSKDLAIKALQKEIDAIERSIHDIGGSDFLRHYTESLRQSVNLTKLEETFVAKFANKYKGK